LKKDSKECGETEWYVVVVVGRSVLYIRAESEEESKAWRREIRSAALRNGTSLQDQQMTNDDVPLIVDKCINFIYAHGILTPFSSFTLSLNQIEFEIISTCKLFQILLINN
jgi:hypothetical protein